MRTIRIGSGAGYSDDLLQPALDSMEKGNLDYIGFECLAERTIAVAQLQKLANPNKGYNSNLEYRMREVLPLAQKNGIKVITNMGAANVEKAVEATVAVAKELGITGLKIVGVAGDSILEHLENYQDLPVLETKTQLSQFEGEIISANAYLGIDGIVRALQSGADIVIAGRCNDAALFLGPLVYEFGWDTPHLMGVGTSVGHLMECSGYLTGGYFSVPGKTDVDQFWNIGYPIAEVQEDGVFYLSKLEDSGGRLDRFTCTEQLLYEIGDPSRYYSPDCVADFSHVTFEETAPNVVKVTGATGYEATDTYKVSIGYRDGFIGTTELSLGGLGCVDRANWLFELAQKRWEMLGIAPIESRFDMIGLNSIVTGAQIPTPPIDSISEVRARIAVRGSDRAITKKLVDEATLGLGCAPAGGGLMTNAVKEVIAVASMLIPKEHIVSYLIEEEV